MNKVGLAVPHPDVEGLDSWNEGFDSLVKPRTTQ